MCRFPSCCLSSLTSYILFLTSSWFCHRVCCLSHAARVSHTHHYVCHIYSTVFCPSSAVCCHSPAVLCLFYMVCIFVSNFYRISHPASPAYSLLLYCVCRLLHAVCRFLHPLSSLLSSAVCCFSHDICCLIHSLSFSFAYVVSFKLYAISHTLHLASCLSFDVYCFSCVSLYLPYRRSSFTPCVLSPALLIVLSHCVCGRSPAGRLLYSLPAWLAIVSVLWAYLASAGCLVSL